MADATGLPWEELHGNLRAFISRRVRNQADVDDLVQRVLLQIVKGLDTLRDSERVHAWIYRTARNVIVDFYRSPASRRETAAGDAQDLESEGARAGEIHAETEDEPAALHELAGCIRPMLARLPDVYREAVTWADLDGRAQADAARQAGVSLSGMKSRVQRGRQQLKAVLQNCCRVDLDRRGTIAGFAPQSASDCGTGCGCSSPAAAVRRGQSPGTFQGANRLRRRTL
jgi:RNA polymerase sigma-70 factor (ECF subfamily)